MTESEFLALADRTLNNIETAIEHMEITSDVDIECNRIGNVLEIEFIESTSKIIVNSQAPMQEIWVAAKSGGFHYKYEAGKWLNTRDSSELFVALSSMLSQQGGIPLMLKKPD